MAYSANIVDAALVGELAQAHVSIIRRRKGRCVESMIPCSAPVGIERPIASFHTHYTEPCLSYLPPLFEPRPLTRERFFSPLAEAEVPRMSAFRQPSVPKTNTRSTMSRTDDPPQSCVDP